MRLKIPAALHEPIKFAIVGAVCTVLHYLFYWIMQWFMPLNLAFSLAYLLSFLFNFLLSSYFTFHVRPSWARLVGMSGAHGCNYLLQISIFNLMLWLGFSAQFAPIPMYAISIPINFLMVRAVFHFRRKHSS